MATAVVSDVEVHTAWRSAIKQHEANFSPKDLTEIKKTKGPDDLLGFIQGLGIEKDRNKVSTLLRTIGALAPYFKAYQRALDIIAQGLPGSGCLIWGCIRTVLSVSTLLYTAAPASIIRAYLTINRRGSPFEHLSIGSTC